MSFGQIGLSQAATGAPANTSSSAYSGGRLMAADPSGGYWTVTAVGAIASYGGAPVFGSPPLSGVRPSMPVVGMAPTANGQGYWLVASDGGIFSYGDAQFYGSTGAIHLNKTIVGMSATPDGRGYWLMASDGGIFSFGDAGFYGSTGAIHLNQPIVSMAATPDGRGYWLVASDGGIFSFGDAQFYGSTGAIQLNQPIVSMAATPDGRGYWLVASDGGIFSFGEAQFYGSLGGSGKSVTGIIISPPTLGYTLVETDGTAAGFSTFTTKVTKSPTTPPTGTSGPVGAGPTTPPPTTRPTGSFLEGAYVGPANPSGVRAFASATHTAPTIASEYLPASSGWSGMDGANGSLSWLTSAWSGSGYTLSLGVPMVPTNANNVPVATLAAGATGAYNSYFVTLAQTLVAAGDANAYLRLGWEFDGNWYAWQALTLAAEVNYAIYFQQIVTAMRSVPGQAFQFVWNPDASAFTTSGYSVADAYPGNAYVNYIGLDIYDQSWATPQTPANAWNSTSLPALTAASQFAAAAGKPIAVAEWGIAIRTDGHGLGDDPLYVNNMIAWMKNPANKVGYASYFDYNTLPSGGDTNADITGGSFPNSLAAFIADLG
jgi:hypothetical protein